MWEIIIKINSMNPCEFIIEIFVKKTQKSKFVLKKISKMTSKNDFKKNFSRDNKTKTDETKNRDKSRLFLIQKQT
jgi:hypothetical protein